MIALRLTLLATAAFAAPAAEADADPQFLLGHGLAYAHHVVAPVVPLSQQVLAKKGVVACEMGRLYNKEAVIEMLLNKDRSTSPPWASHIEKLKDVVELDLTIN